ncbi:MAG: EAL domain-containing protein, partial [Gammaproteobacteria bacterium]
DQFISTIITMAENMGLYVIAEGVETEAQRGALVALGCPGYQGYLISKPLNARMFMDWLKTMPANRPPQPAPELRIS